MALDLHSLDELGARARGYFRQYLPGSDAWIRQNFVSVTAKVLAQFARHYELREQWIFRQLFVRSCTFLPVLRMHGADVRVYLKPASASSGSLSGIGQPGMTYPAGVRWLSAGQTYVSTRPFAAGSDGLVAPHVQAETAGAATNRDGGARLTLADPAMYPSLSDFADVSGAGLGGGADVEDIEAFRGRILARKGNPPQGGSLDDYERFALEVPGVRMAWAYPFTGGIGSIAVFFLFDGRAHLIPTQSDVDVVQAHIDAKRLIRVDDAVAVAPLAISVDIMIGALTVDTPDVRAAISSRLAAMFLDRCRPGVASQPFTLSRSWISEAISTAAGEDSHTLISPASDIVFSAGYPVLGTVDYA